MGQRIEIGDGSILVVKGLDRIGIFEQIYYSPNLGFNHVAVDDLSNYGFSVMKLSKWVDILFLITVYQLRELRNIDESNSGNLHNNTTALNYLVSLFLRNFNGQR